MPTKAELLDEMRRLATEQGPEITLFKFREQTGISRYFVYDRWGNWTNLRRAAGLPPRITPTPVYPDEELLGEFNQVAKRLGHYPTINEFSRCSERSWNTLNRRFGRKDAVVDKYRVWLDEQPADDRPLFLAGVRADSEPTAIPGVERLRNLQPPLSESRPDPLEFQFKIPEMPPELMEFSALTAADVFQRLRQCARPMLILLLAVALTFVRPAMAYQQPRDDEFSDGCLTSRKTFQKFYSQHELREWIQTTLGVEPVAAAPGVFFVFRDDALRQTFGAARYRRSAATPRPSLREAQYQQHRELLQPLADFVAERGRLPVAAELPLAAIEEVFGTVKRAFALIQRVTGAEQWDRIRDERSQDLLVYLALAQFSQRARFSALPTALQLDVKAFFGGYPEACRRADELLFSAGDTAAVNRACGAAPCGKATHDALYVHTAGLPLLPPILRVFEGCARNYVGQVEGANLVKLHRFKPKVSYLAYPDFDADPHPALTGALVVPLDNFDVKYWDYAASQNPPILHRKEEFVPAEYPGREKFAKLTKQEERAGLFENTVRIGHREDWRHALENRGVTLRGHRLVRMAKDA